MKLLFVRVIRTQPIEFNCGAFPKSAAALFTFVRASIKRRLVPSPGTSGVKPMATKRLPGAVDSRAIRQILAASSVKSRRAMLATVSKSPVMASETKWQWSFVSPMSEPFAVIW